MSATDTARADPRAGSDATPDPRALAAAAARELAALAGVGDLADGVADAAGRGFRTALMAHQLALNHRLVMRFGAMADEFLAAAKPSAHERDRQIGRESVRFAAVAARLGGRVRQAALALAKLKAAAAKKDKSGSTGRCADCKREHGDPDAVDGDPQHGARLRARARQAASELSESEEIAALAYGATRGIGENLPARLLAHELALGHQLIMRFGATADCFLDYTSATIDRDRRQIGRDSLPFAAIAARLGEGAHRVHLALAALTDADLDLRDQAKRRKPRFLGCDKCGVIFNERTGRWIFAEPENDGGGSTGGGTGGVTPPVGSAPPSGASAPPAAAAGHGVDRSDSILAAAARRGRLRNNNPCGDYLKAPRCGARTRAGGCCRQPAMKNGRCRLHGGKSTGPRTGPGLANSRAARLRHGCRSAPVIALRSAAFRHGRRLVDLTRRAQVLAQRDLGTHSSTSWCKTGLSPMSGNAVWHEQSVSSPAYAKASSGPGKTVVAQRKALMLSLSKHATMSVRDP